MTNLTTGANSTTIGIDLGDRFSDIAAIDSSGELFETGRVRTTPDAFHKRFGNMPSTRIAIEVGTHSPWISELLTAAGHDVIVANPRKLRLIYANNNKNDKVDAENLARVARLDPKLLCPISHRHMDTRSDLALLRARDSLVTNRTQLVNQARGLVKPFGKRLPGCSTAAFWKRAAWAIPKELRPAVVPLLRLIKTLTIEIKALEKKIRELADNRYPETRRLREVNGVGLITSLAFVLTIEDPLKMASSRSCGAYLGLVPRRKQSGKADPELRITKAGDMHLRRLLVQCAQYILGPFGKDSNLRRFGLSLAERGKKNAKRRAIVAVARKLAVLLHRLWITDQPYEALRKQGAKQTLECARTA